MRQRADQAAEKLGGGSNGRRNSLPHHSTSGSCRPVGQTLYCCPALQFITKLNASTLPIPVAKFQEAPVL